MTTLYGGCPIRRAVLAIDMTVIVASHPAHRRAQQALDAGAGRPATAAEADQLVRRIRDEVRREAAAKREQTRRDHALLDHLDAGAKAAVQRFRERCKAARLRRLRLAETESR